MRENGPSDNPSPSAPPPPRRKSKGKLLAHLEGKVFLADRDVSLKYTMRTNTLVMGRSDPAFIRSDPFKPAKSGVHLGLGISNKLSRAHARIDYLPVSHSFTISCHGKNGLSVTLRDNVEHRLTHDSPPFPLPSNTLLKIADCILVFSLPSAPPISRPSPPPPPTRKRKRREWIKAEHDALRKHMMRLGYGRWNHIIAATNGRLSERQPSELVPVARRFVARCYIHARPGVEQKALMDILRIHPLQIHPDDADAVHEDIQRMLQVAHEDAEEGEKRKYVRWARKLRLLSRLRDVHDHPSLERLKRGDLRVFTSPPALYWTSEDDVDLILGSYKHGYGATEAIRQDPHLGFLGRYSKPLSIKKNGTPSKTDKPSDPVNGSEDEDDDDEGPDEDEDDRHAMSINEDLDEDNAPEAPVPNPKKRLKLGNRVLKKEDVKVEDVAAGAMDDSDMSPLDAKMEPKLSKTDKPCDPVNGSENDDEDDEGSAGNDLLVMSINEDFENNAPVPPEVPVHIPKKRLKLGARVIKKDEIRIEGAVTGAMDDSDVSSLDAKMDSKLDEGSDKGSKDDLSDVEKTKKKRLVPKRGPRIGNDDGFNDPEDAKAAAESMADENGLVPFPNSESLMRRLKSTIISCAKEYDRDQREVKKKELAASRAKQRKDELAARKAEKEAEKTLQRAERRIAKSQPFSKKEALEFERALSNFGVVYKDDGKTVNWSLFHGKVDGFDAKYDDTLDAAYLELLSEAHRINDLAAAKEDEDYEAVDRINEKKKASVVFSTLTVERAEKLIERLEFFRALRGEVLSHSSLNSILRGIKKTRDLPLWWKSSHDKSLLFGVDRYGLNGWECMGVDAELSFSSSMKAWQRKTGNDVKSLKRAAMPKSSSGIKRAFALVQYFRSRANDPHFEFYNRENEGKDQSGVGVSSNAQHVEVKQEVDEEKVFGQCGTRKGMTTQVKKGVSGIGAAGTSSTRRPRTLRQSLVKIEKDERGDLILPVDLGRGLFLLNLGEVAQGAHGFCQDGIIFPVGYRSVRQMSGGAFLCEIMASQDRSYPEFRVSALERFDGTAKDEDTMWSGQREIGSGKNIVTLWMQVLKEVGRDGDNNNRVTLSSGPERFGLYEHTIVYHIQKMVEARCVEGLEAPHFNVHGGDGTRVEASVGILDVMLKALDVRLKRPDGLAYDSVMTDYQENAREGAVVAEQMEMSIPQEWILEHDSSKRKHRRTSSFYWS